jgi:DNA-binding transcriptional MerR regulator
MTVYKAAMEASSLPRYQIDELAALAGVPRRTVRYYIQLGLVDRPIGERRAAYYTPDHLEQLLTVVKYANAGLALDRIADLLAAPQSVVVPPVPRVGTVSVQSHLTVADGVEVVIEPGRAGLSPEQVRALFAGVLDLYGRITEEKDHGR